MTPTLRLTIATVPAGQEHLRSWIARYQAAQPAIAVQVQAMNATRAQEALAQGKVDLALLEQLPAPEYQGILTATEVVREPLAIVVHPANPLRNLPAVAVAELLSGRVMNWNQVGGADLPLQVYLLPDSAGEMVALAGPALAGRRPAPQGIVCASRESLRTAVASDPGGIGVLLYSFTEGPVVVLHIDGTAPDSPAYPWQVPLFLAHGPAGPDPALAFVRFVRGITKGE